MSGELWAVTCYYNPARYRTKALNFARFAAALSARGIPFRVIECAFGSAAFELSQGDTLRVRGQDVMWQKERLLNLAIASLPRFCTKVAWLDCDVLFENPSWYEMTSAALERFEVVQPFETVVRLPPGATAFTGVGEVQQSFAAVYVRSRELARSRDFTKHGHPGYAWAARREWLQIHGLYDSFLAGDSDHLMAHVFAGDVCAICIHQLFGAALRHRRHFDRWARALACQIGGRLGSVPGRIVHLWHGSTQRRSYVQRNREFRRFDLDPEADLRTGNDGLLEWASARSGLREWAAEFFSTREEDAVPGVDCHSDRDRHR